MRNQWLVLLLVTLLFISALATHSSNNLEANLIAAATSQSPAALVLLTVDEYLRNDDIVECKPGFGCPFPEGTCCPGNEVCCPFSCFNTSAGLTCGPNKLENALDRMKDPVKAKAAAAERQYTFHLKTERERERLAKELKEKNQREHTEKRIDSAQEQAQKAIKDKTSKKLALRRAKEHTLHQLEEDGQKREEAQKQSQRPVPMINRWTAYGQGYRGAQFSRLESVCVVTGMVRGPVQNNQIAKMPTTCRPERRMVFDLHVGSTTTMRYDLLPTGELEWQPHQETSGVAAGWLPLDGITFPVLGTKLQQLSLVNPWVNYDADGFQGGAYYKKGGLCALTGLVRTDDWYVSRMQSQVFLLPFECRPDRRISFLVNNDFSSLRIDILANGQGRIIAGKKAVPWISLSNVFYYQKCKQYLNLVEGWRAYGTPFRAPCVTKEGSMCTLSGVARPTQGWRSMIAKVMDDCRPEAKLSFTVPASNGGAQRLDVWPDGRIQFVEGSRGWVSFDGIRYMVE